MTTVNDFESARYACEDRSFLTIRTVLGFFITLRFAGTTNTEIESNKTKISGHPSVVSLGRQWNMIVVAAGKPPLVSKTTLFPKKSL